MHSSTHGFVWDPGIGSQLHRANRVAHIFGLLEGKQSWGGRSVIFPFLVSPTTGLGWTSRVRRRQGTGTDWCYQRAQGLFGGVLGNFSDVRWHSLDIFHHPSNLPFVSVHSDNFQKIELFLGLTQLITLKVAFWEEYMIEHLSVIAHWNREEETYMMGQLDIDFSDRRRHGSQFTLFYIKKEYFNKRKSAP